MLPRYILHFANWASIAVIALFYGVRRQGMGCAISKPGTNRTPTMCGMLLRKKVLYQQLPQRGPMPSKTHFLLLLVDSGQSTFERAQVAWEVQMPWCGQLGPRALRLMALDATALTFSCPDL